MGTKMKLSTNTRKHNNLTFEKVKKKSQTSAKIHKKVLKSQTAILGYKGEGQLYEQGRIGFYSIQYSLLIFYICDFF